MSVRGFNWTACAASTLALVVACSASNNKGSSGSVGTPGSSVGLPGGTGTNTGTTPGASTTGTGNQATGTPGTLPGGGTTPGPTAGSGGAGSTTTPTPVPGGGAGAGAPGGGMTTPPTGTPTASTPHGSNTCLKPSSGDYTSPGPYQVGMMDVDLGMVDPNQGTGKYTIFYPMPLETSCPHPIVAWGNGTGVTGSSVYAFLNQNAASWGIVVAAAQDSNTGSGLFHKAGIDWLLKQNMDSTSMFYQKLSTRAGVSGHSQGGIGASAGSTHPNVETAAIEGMQMNATQKVSVLILTGTKDIINGDQVGAGAATQAGPMFVADWDGGDHFTTETLGGFIAGDKGSLQFQRLYAAWFRCFLADDQTACKLFSGGTPSSCGICKDPGWHLLASNIK